MVFAEIREISNFERVRFPFLEIPSERDILVVIGNAEESGAPISYKQLVLERICSPATLRRKLARLVALGAVVRSRDGGDQRTKVLRVAAPLRKAFEDYLLLLRKGSGKLRRANGKRPLRAVALRASRSDHGHV